MFSRLIVVTLVLAVAYGASLPGLHKFRPGGRIIGGELTTIEDNPWEVSLQINGIHFCGGSIISEDVILTTAHCINYPITADTVVAGTADLEINGVKVGINSAVIHEKFIFGGYDVAIIKLKTKLEFNDQIQPVTLAEQELEVGAEVNVTGWGVLSDQEIFTSTELLTINLNIVDHKICKQTYSNLDKKVDDTMICANFKTDRQGACWGDFGSPLTKDGIQYGIVSWGVGCALAEYPGVYTNVAAVREWIRENAGV